MGMRGVANEDGFGKPFKQKPPSKNIDLYTTKRRVIFSQGCAKHPTLLWHILNSSLLMQISYGWTVTSLDDKFVKLATTVTTAVIEAGGPTTTLVDFFPIMKYWPLWLPGSGFRIHAIDTAELLREWLDIPYEMVSGNMANGNAKPSILESLIKECSREGDPTPDDKENIKGAVTSLYGAGTDTTVTVITTFILTMVLHRDVFLKAQAEVDRVTGGSRLPDFDDRDSMPYLECVLKEVYRWGCPLPLGVPHRLTEDDEYDGHHLPAGSTIIPNIWVMTRKPEIYPDPERFWPERFEALDSDTADLYDPRKLIFGFGRRICPGRIFADHSVWLAVASILSSLDIRKARNAAGEEVSPVPAFKSGIVSHVVPFECDIQPRSGKAISISES
ncbi:uncharacterized protein FIBRA_03471 [Fibroporia radiculosa]|uniref:Cytochrome P450 n=1 Tax=Fibroporia radiculosa TaxID=599839 RepID=J4GNH9_9APHY|nr:uncharacterized protein FIBRA_03471 [Fibroporia radiculosa]CCM01420.1 predicted protein [Fibroporia radiculosa]